MTTLQTPPPIQSDVPSMQKRVEGRLAALRTKVRAQIALDGIARALGLIVGLLLLGLVLDWWLELSVVARLAYWAVTLAGGGYLLYRFMFAPLGVAMGPLEVAEAVDLARKAKGDALIAPRVSTVLYLPAAMGDEQAVSGSMVYDAVSRSYAKLQDNPFDRQTSGKHLTWCVVGLAVSIMLPALLTLTLSGTMDVWANRWVKLNNTPWPRNTQLAVDGLNKDGQLIVPAGEDVTLRFTASNKDGSEIKEVRLSLRPEGAGRDTYAVDTFAAGDYRYELAPHTAPIQARLSAGDQDLDFTIVPIARPRVLDLELVHTHPSDGVARTLNFDGADGGLALLDLNQVELTITTNVPISDVRYAQGSDQPASIELVDETHAVLKWKHVEDVRFRLELVGKEAGLVSQPVPIAVRVKRDRVPRVTVRSEGVGQRITANALVPLTLDGRDDLGLTRMTLVLSRDRTTASGRESFEYPAVEIYGPVEEATLDKLLKKYGLEVEDLELTPTDILRVTATATDNRYTGSPGGEQTGESSPLSFSIVTHDELFREIRGRQELARAQFRQAIEDAKDIKDQLDLAKTGEEAAAQARLFRQAQRNVGQVSGVLAASAEEMRLNRLGGSREDGNQAYEAIREGVLMPLNQLYSDTMRQQRDRLEAAGRSTPEQIEQLAVNQQAVIDEMNEVLKAMARWDQLMDVINQLNEVIDLQERIKPRLEEMQDEEFDDFFDE